MPGRGVKERAGYVRQLDFDSLAEVSSDIARDGQAANGTKPDIIPRPALQPFSGTRHKFRLIPRGIQYTLDVLFVESSQEEPDARSQETADRGAERQPIYEQPVSTQLTFDALPQPLSDVAGTASEREHAGRTLERESGSVVRPDVRTGDSAGDGIFESEGDSGRPVLIARRRRVRLDGAEPEPAKPSRDFRITEEHHVGTGGLHEKARANIKAIKLLKMLEAENREAVDQEKAILVRYTSWGALKDVFEPEWRIKPEWKATASELQELLTPEEYESARATTPNAHFTSPLVINAIWSGLQKLGVEGSVEVLEPAMGVGHFYGLMPEALTGGHRTGVELDSLTARIAQKLYPDTKIFAQGFEETHLPDNYYDLVVGNVPFGDYPVHDPHTRRGLTRSIHDYFFAKSLEKVRPGGILALITSRYTMDKQDTTIRSYLAEKADLIAAIRLPNTAFKSNAGTEVTTDILFLQKRKPGQEQRGEQWTTTKIISIAGEGLTLNEYYIKYPEMMLGEMTLQGTQYRSKEPTLTGELTRERLDEAIRALPDSIYTPRGHKMEIPALTFAEPDHISTIKDGGYGVVNGKIVIRNGNRLEEISLTVSETARVRGLMHIRDAVREVFRTQLDGESEERIIAAREQLNRVYDQFVSRHGTINGRENYRVFSEDPDYPVLLSLEHYDQETKRATKAVVFTKRTLERYVPVEQVETASEALAVSLNETGGISWERMASLTGLSVKQIQTELGSQVYQNVDGTWETADEYLSGDVRVKLITAEAATIINPLFLRNVEALNAVQPEDILPGDIHARLGASWIPKTDIQEFIAHMLQVPAHHITVSHAGEIATWSVIPDFTAARSVSNTTTHGTKRMSAADLIEAALNLRVPTIYDTLPDDSRVVNQTETITAREAQQKLKDRFSKWIWEDPGRTERLARVYNDKFNNIRLRTYDGSHLTLPGMMRANLRKGDLDPHQKNAVWRILQNKNALIGHVVGSGKAQPLDAKILTPTGWKFMGDIKVGDTVIAGDGSRTKVEAVFPQGEKDIYRVTFQDGSSTECCDEHLWVTRTYLERNFAQRSRKLGKDWNCGKPKVRSLSEIRATLRAPHLNAINHSIPMVGTVHFIKQPVPIDPYLLGVIIGDGSTRSIPVRIALHDEEIIENCRAALPADLKIARTNEKRCPTWSITRVKQSGFGANRTKNSLVKSLIDLGVMGCLSYNKFIPKQYLINSSSVRLALLQGLMDTDGSLNKKGHSSYFYTVSEQLAKDVTFIVQSLGGVVRLHTKKPKYRHNGELRNGTVCYVLCMSLPPKINPFRLSRKAKRVVPKSKYKPIRYIKDVQPVGKKPAQCIRVSHPSHLYVTDDCIVTHNTASMTAACMELKRVGLAKKPIIVVPNHLTEQWGAAFLALYPQANIFIAGKEHFTTGKREKAMARIATSNYDAVIISHKSFESLPVSDNTFHDFMSRQFESLEEALQEAQAEKGDNRSIIKSLEKAKKRLEAKIKDHAKREKKDKGVTFEQLGVDRIFVDEADLFKNLGFTTKMQRIAGLPNSDSNRSTDMYMKTRYVSEQGGGVVFATGTPISNTMAELYTLQRYLAPELLEQAGVAHFDAWAANFGEAVTALELAPDGSGYRMHTRFARFVNLPELLSMFRTFADIQTADMLHLPRPALAGGKPQVIVSPASPALKEFVSSLVERAQKIRGGGVAPTVDNMLKITTDGRKAALDMRLIMADAKPDDETKVSKAVHTIYQTWQNGKEERLTQAVFCDMSTPNPDRFNVYDDIRERLVALGIPEKEIAYIHHADTDAKKQALFDAVNAGAIRILCGSTEKMGAGTNVQQRLVALHHLDAPWRPRDIEQRDGRILRQGNTNPQVSIYRYVTEGSFDAYMWQTLETKASFIQQVMNGKTSVREVEDLESGALSFAEIKAIASGNPLVMEKVKIDTEVRRLDMLRAAHCNQQFDIARQVRDLPGRIEQSREYHEGLLQDVARRDANDGEFSMTIADREFSGKNAREDAGKALLTAITASLWGDSRELQHLGNYRGFAIMCGRNGTLLLLYVRGKNTYQASLNTESALGTIYSIEAVIRSLDHYAEEEQSEFERKEKALEDYREQLHRPFEHEEQLRELLMQQQETNRKLDLDKSDNQVVAENGEEENVNGSERLATRRTARAEAQLAGSAAM